MAHATRRDVPRPAQPALIRAKALRPDPAPVSEQQPEKRPTWRPPARQSGIQVSADSHFRPRADSGVCLEEEVSADLSKDPRHEA
jgi:hypothetical protein